MTTAKPLVGLAALLAVALALLAALVVPRLGGAGRPEPDPTAGLLAELRELRRAQERTADVLGRLEAFLGARLEAPPPEPAARSPQGELPTPESFEALARSLDAVRVAFERESTQTRELLRAAPALHESLRELRTRRAEIDWAALEQLETRWRGDPEGADRSQHFQTARDLLEAYGPPTAIYRPKSGMLFHYRRAEGEPGPSWYFRLQEGFVVEFFVEDEPAEEPESG